MADETDDRATGDATDPDGSARHAPAGTSTEPLVSGDPLGLGGVPDPDAPSRRPKPELLSLAGEFFRMSRATAILLTMFVLAGALYLLVREVPVVSLGPAGPTEPAEPANATPSDATTTEGTEGTTQSEETSAPTSSTTATQVPTGPGDDDEVAESPAPNQAPTGTSAAVPGISVPSEEAPSGDGTTGGQDGGGAADGGTAPTE